MTIKHKIAETLINTAGFIAVKPAELIAGKNSSTAGFFASLVLTGALTSPITFPIVLLGDLIQADWSKVDWSKLRKSSGAR